jgi:hypothetical protein
LYAVTTDFLNAQNISDDHPAVAFLRDLEATALAYYPDENLLRQKIHLAILIFHAVLRSANNLKYRLKVGAPYVLWFNFSVTTS